MDKVALLPAGDRAALLGETGAGRGVADTIIEKDFWVCWCLKRLFGLPKGTTATLVFKGGTSLSKAFGAIRRFSEDIDLSFDRAELGYTGDRDPEKEAISKKQAARLIDELVSDVTHHIAEKLVPALRAAIIEQLGEAVNGQWSLEIYASDAQTVNFHYPTAHTITISQCCWTPTKATPRRRTLICSLRSPGTKRRSFAPVGRAMTPLSKEAYG